MEFSKIGMVNTRTFINQGIVAKKFYQREGAEFDESVSKMYDGGDIVQIDNSTGGEEEDGPFQPDNVDDELFGDGEDDFFGNDDF